MFQQLTAIGNLGRDPESRVTQSGTGVTSFSVACSEKWKSKQTGQWEEKTEWINCVAFGRLAEICGEYLRKGSKVMVQGKLSTSSWEQDGVKRYKTEVIISEMKMLDSRGGGQSESRQSAPSQKSAPQQDDFDDDIPF